MSEIGESFSEEPKKSNRGRKTKKINILPETGILTPEGYPFYHVHCVLLTEEQYKRVEENGVNLRTKRPFTLDETVQIFNNWKEFADEHNLKRYKATEYIRAKVKDKFERLHQTEHHFWPKLCKGLPHRAGVRIKLRAEKMMTDSFLKDLNWDDPAPQISARYFAHDGYDAKKLQIARKLAEKGYSSEYMAEYLDLTVAKVIAIKNKLKTFDDRDDPMFRKQFFDCALSCGLDSEKLRNRLVKRNEEKYKKVQGQVDIEELAMKMKVSETRSATLLEELLEKIWISFRKSVDEGKGEEEAFKEAMKVTSSMPFLTFEQQVKALEIFCLHMDKADTSLTLAKTEEFTQILHIHKITGFSCNMPEQQYLHKRICKNLMIPLEDNLFQHLRRNFPFRLKLHCLLWSWKKYDEWETLPVGTDETRYEAVLRSELSNPLATKLTKKFLKDKLVAEWIMEPRPTKTWRNKPHLRVEAGYEAFILYAHQRSFKFPQKLHHLTPNPPGAVRKILEEESDDSEYLTAKEVKEAVKSATESALGVKVKTKLCVMKDEQAGCSDEDSEGPDDVDKILKHARHLKKKWKQKERLEIDEIVQNADPSGLRKKFQKKDVEEDENAENLKVSKKLLKEKKAMEKAAKAKKKAESKSTKLRITSKEFVTTSDDDSDEEEGSEVVHARKEIKMKEPNAREDVPITVEVKESRKRRTSDVVDSEEVPSTSKTKKIEKTSIKLRTRANNEKRDEN
ncbi:unnamed protein product [Caenorhabditis sp. 36 PRJEB53466]|nr:unnamed protein product [Caenorhabditis sp. 36 PRJEB53466]